jgi:DNA-binding beta-propeller fold protein YncE
MKAFTLAAALVASTALAGAAQAQSVAALVGDDTIAIIDVGAKKVSKTMKVSGASGKIVGIDVRPADGMLYAATADGSIWTIDPATGKATQKSKVDMPLPKGDIVFDFNPAADRLRVIGEDGTNLRINVDDGKVTKDGNLKFADADQMKGKTPKIVAGAYTNSMKGAKETTLYDVDATGSILRQAPPNEGVLNTVGQLGMKAEDAAFDVVSMDGGQNEGWLMSGDTLHKVDLQTGKGTPVGKIAGVSGNVRDIAVLPKM